MVIYGSPFSLSPVSGPYNALKVDIWSLGATVWELAETVPPFSMPASPSTQTPFAVQTARHVGSQWPPLTHPQHYSRGFHEFLRLCGREAATRPGPEELLNVSLISRRGRRTEDTDSDRSRRRSSSATRVGVVLFCSSSHNAARSRKP